MGEEAESNSAIANVGEVEEARDDLTRLEEREIFLDEMFGPLVEYEHDQTQQ